MIKALKIYKPLRRICAGKTVKYPITKLDPSLWTKSNVYTSTTIDGYVINGSGNVTALLSRYEFEGQIQNRAYFTDTLKANHQEEITAQLQISNLLNVPFRVLLWPCDFPNDKPSLAKQIIIYFPKIENNKLNLSHAKLINLKGLEAGIEKYRGRSFKSVKSLQTANSNLECYLANNTKNPWPGDLDGVLIDKKTNHVVALLEYKTHNIDSPIEKEFIGKYGKQDWRRFEVLFKLQMAIEKSQGTRPKLFFIVWGTKNINNHKNIKIDEIDKGEVLTTSYLTRPIFGQPSLDLIKLLTD